MDASPVGVPAVHRSRVEVQPGLVVQALSPAGAATRAALARRTKRRLWAVALVLAAALGFLIYKVLTSAIVYFKTTNQAVAERAQLGSSTFQIEGVVVPGTLRHRVGGTLDFSIRGGGATVPVENTGAPPQLFQANVPVVLVGHFVGGSDTFASDQILVKHSNAYIAAHPGRVRGPTGEVVR
ncbi:MAG: cytochrome c maturation protein CcmE [Acidimicrobiales bacterium]